MDKTIFDLELHERTQIDSITWVTRVPGGWIYTMYENDDEVGQNTVNLSTVFVPKSLEFFVSPNE